MNTRTHTITDTTSTRTAQHSTAQHSTAQHTTSSPPLPLPFPSPHTHTLTHANIMNFLFPFSMAMTNDHSLSQLSVHRARICPERHSACALVLSLRSRATVRKRENFDGKKGLCDKKAKNDKKCHFLAPFSDRKPPFFFDQKCRFGVLIEKNKNTIAFFDSVWHHLSVLWLFWASLFS